MIICLIVYLVTSFKCISIFRTQTEWMNNFQFISISPRFWSIAICMLLICSVLPVNYLSFIPSRLKINLVLLFNLLSSDEHITCNIHQHQVSLVFVIMSQAHQLNLWIFFYFSFVLMKSIKTLSLQGEIENALDCSFDIIAREHTTQSLFL